jgi:hypothetical protein
LRERYCFLQDILTASNPSEIELELQLRKEASKSRVVERLAGGAHILFPGSETIALRTYYPSDIARLEAIHNDENDVSSLNRASAAPNNQDGLEAFRNAFKYPIVFFILPPEILMDQLSRPESFVNVAQLIMNEPKQGNDASAAGGNAKSFVVPDTKSVTDTVLILLDALHPERRKMREKYYEHTRSLHFLPAENDEFAKVVDTHQIATHVSAQIRSLADRLQLGAGEAEILMRRLGSLQRIATADHRVLEHMPIDDASKEKLHEFFGTEGNPNMQVEQNYNSLPPQQEIAHIPVAEHNFSGSHIEDHNFDHMPNYNEFTNEQSQNQFAHLPQHDLQGYNQFASDATQSHQQFAPQNQFPSQHHQQFAPTQPQFAMTQHQFATAPFQGHHQQQHQQQQYPPTPAQPPFMQPHPQQQHNGGYQGNAMMMQQQMPAYSYRPPTSQWNNPPPPSARPYSQAPPPKFSETPRLLPRFAHSTPRQVRQQQRYPPSTTRKFGWPQGSTSRASAIGQYFG